MTIQFGSIELVSIAIDSIKSALAILWICFNSIKFDHPIRFDRIGFRCNRFDRNGFIDWLNLIEFDRILEPQGRRSLAKLGSGSHLGTFWIPFGIVLGAIWERCDANGRHLKAIQISIEFLSGLEAFWDHVGRHLRKCGTLWEASGSFLGRFEISSVWEVIW